MASCAFRLWSLRKFDVIVAMTSPPLISFLASSGRALEELAVWFSGPWISIPTRRLLRDGCEPNRRLLVYYPACYCTACRRADCIVALDRFMRHRIQAKGISAEKVMVVPPWSHDDCVRFDPAGREEFRRKL